MGYGFNPRDYRQFSIPGEYHEAIKENDCRVPIQFFIAASNIMKKHDMIFHEVCELLEEKGYLIWANDKVAIYNVEGDSLWK